MIFVIGFSYLSRGPDDQGLSLRPRVKSSSGKGLSEAALKRLKSGEKGEKGIAGARCGRHRWWSGQAYGPGGKVERRRTAPGSLERAIAGPVMK
jgi:hypothetical protein